ncbi:MAG: universal stress protein [Planctomycetota bacterium]
MLKRILVGLGDVDHTVAAVARGVELAKTHQAELTGVTLFDVDRLDHAEAVPIGAGVYAKELGESRIEQAREVISAAAAHFETACDEANVPHATVHETGNPMTAMISHARYHDVIITGVRGLFEHGVIEEPSDELAHLVHEGVRPLIAVTKRDRTVRKALIAYSGSMESAKTMKRFVQLRLWPDAELRVVTFHPESGSGQVRLEHAVDYCRAHGFEPSSECISAPPMETLLPYAEQWNADLIVLGNSAKNLLLRKILGDTALHAMRHSKQALFLAQ